MADPKDGNKRQPGDLPAGRVRHDASGRAIWEWAVDTGRHALESTSRLLKRLELPGLELEDESRKRKDEAAKGASAPPTPEPKDDNLAFGGPRETDPLAGSRRSFNPYDNKSPPRPAPRAASRRPAPAPQKPAQKPGLLGRLFGRR